MNVDKPTKTRLITILSCSLCLNCACVVIGPPTWKSPVMCSQCAPRFVLLKMKDHGLFLYRRNHDYFAYDRELRDPEDLPLWRSFRALVEWFRFPSEDWVDQLYRRTATAIPVATAFVPTWFIRASSVNLPDNPAPEFISDIIPNHLSYAPVEL